MSAHLPDRVEREAEGVLVAQPLVADLLGQGRVAHHAVERDQHREEERQLVDRRHLALDEHRALVRVDPDGEPVGRDVDHALADLVRPIGPRRERVLVGDQEVAIVLVLQRQPVFDAADVMPEVQPPGRRVAGEDAGFVCCHGFVVRGPSSRGVALFPHGTDLARRGEPRVHRFFAPELKVPCHVRAAAASFIVTGSKPAWTRKNCEIRWKRACRGDLRAYARLVEATQTMVYAVARRILRNREAARDATQETYLRIFHRLKELRDPLAFPLWLRRVAANTARSLARARRRYFLEAEAAADLPVLDEQEAAWSEQQRAALAGAVLTLPADDRTLCDRYYHGGWTTARLAADGGVTGAAVRKRLRASATGCERRLRCRSNMSWRANTRPRTCRCAWSRPARAAEAHRAARESGGRRLAEAQAQLPEFEEVDVPEIVADAQLAEVFGQDFADEYLQGVASIVHRAGADRFLRPELDVPLLMQLRNHAGPLRALSAGKVYRDEEPGRTRLQAFHQAELLLVDRGLGEWSFMDRLMQMLAVPNRRLRQEQVSFPLCTRGRGRWKWSGTMAGSSWHRGGSTPSGRYGCWGTTRSSTVRSA